MGKITFLIFSFICLTAQAQQWQWARTADSTTAMQRIPISDANKICSDNFGNVYALGNNAGQATFGNIVLGAGSFVIKYNTFGNFQWAKHINNNGRDIATDGYGNLYVLDDSIYSPTNYNVYKFDSSGTLLWKKSFAGWAPDLTVDQIGDIFVTGKDSEFFLTKLNSNGVVGWRTSRFSNYATSFFGSGRLICLDKRGTIYVVGSGMYANCYSCSGWFLAKYDTLGNLIYSNFKWGENADNFGLAVDDSLKIYSMYSTGGHYFTGYDLAKYDSLLNPIWINHYNSYGDYGFAKGFSVDNSGNIFMGGEIGDDWGNIDSVLVYNQWIHVKGYEDIAVLKLDPAGNFVWLKTAGGKGREIPEGICMDKFGNCYLAGNINLGFYNEDTVSFDNSTVIAPADGGQIFVAKLNLTSNMAIETLAGANTNVFLFPNPTSGVFNICLSGHKDRPKVTIHDVLGNCLFEKDYRGETTIQIDLSCQPKGVYFIEVMSGEAIEAKKIIVE